MAKIGFSSNSRYSPKDNILIEINESEFSNRISLKSMIFNVEMDTHDYIIVFHKVPSRENFRKFIKAINEEYRIKTYQSKRYYKGRHELDLTVKEMYNIFNQKRLDKKESHIYVNNKPMFECIFGIYKWFNDNKTIVSLHASNGRIYDIFINISSYQDEAKTVLVDFENIDF